jgi:Flagellar basal body protein
VQSAGQVRLASTDPAHITASSGSGAFATERPGKYEVRPAGNAVNLEDEMMKVAGNQMDYQAAISLYSRSMGLFRTALGKR